MRSDSANPPLPAWLNQHSRLASVACILGCSLLATASLAAGLAAVICVALLLVEEPRRSQLIVVLVGISFGLLALLKRPESDQLYYLWYIDGIREAGLNATSSWGVFSIRRTEPLFIAYSMLFSTLSNGNIQFIFVSTFIVFVASGFSYIHIATSRGISVLATLAFAFLVSISVFSAGHLVRQYLALSLFTVAIACWLTGHDLRAGILALVSTTIHNSNALLLFPLATGFTFRRFPKTTLIGLVVAAIAGRILLSSFADFVRVLDKRDGTVPGWLMLVDAGLMAALLMTWWQVRWQDLALDRIVGFSLALFAFLLAVSDLQLLFLRAYVFLEFWRPVVLLALLSRTNLHRDFSVKATLIVLSGAFFMFRLDSTPWDYGGRADRVLGFSMSQFVERISATY